MAEKLTELSHGMWGKKAIPQEFNDASITHRYKRKGNSRVYDNHRGICLLAIAGKITSKTPVESLEYSSWPDITYLRKSDGQ